MTSLKVIVGSLLVGGTVFGSVGYWIWKKNRGHRPPTPRPTNDVLPKTPRDNKRAEDDEKKAHVPKSGEGTLGASPDNNRTQTPSPDDKTGVETDGKDDEGKGEDKTSPDDEEEDGPRGPLCVRGPFHQGHADFGKYAGAQCMVNGLTAIVMSTVKPILTWVPTDLSEALVKGHEIYSVMRQQLLIAEGHRHVSTSELPSGLDCNNGFFSVEVVHGQTYSGHFGREPTEEWQGTLFGLKHALVNAFSECDTCFVTISASTCAVVKTNDWFSVFDSHPRGATGLHSANGSSVLVHHRGLDALYLAMCGLGQSLNADGLRFEVAGIKVTRQRKPLRLDISFGRE